MNVTTAPAPGYWAVLPAGIRYDDRIPANAKLLYAEISSLTGASGYCWADNGYFAELYKITERSVRRLLKALEVYGYIRIEEERGAHNELDARRIFAGINPLAKTGASGGGSDGFTLDKIVQSEGHFGQNCPDFGQNCPKTLYKNNQEILTRVRKPKKTGPQTGSPVWLPERFAAFWDYYRRIPGEGGKARNENRQKAAQAWDRLRPDDELLRVIGRALLRQTQTPEWSRGVGIPMAATYLNQRRWEDAADLPDAPANGQDAPRRPLDGGEVKVRWL